jgi:hypothetical protein
MEWRGVSQRLVQRVRVLACFQQTNYEFHSEKVGVQEHSKQRKQADYSNSSSPTNAKLQPECAAVWTPAHVELIETLWLESSDQNVPLNKQHLVGVYLAFYDPPSTLLPKLVLDVGHCFWRFQDGTSTLCITYYSDGSASAGTQCSSKPRYRPRGLVGLRDASPLAMLQPMNMHDSSTDTGNLIFAEKKQRSIILGTLVHEMLRSKAALSGVNERYVHAVYELVATEALYVADLQTILRAFLYPIRDAYKVGLLPLEYERQLIDSFSNTQVLAKVHEDLLQELSDCFREWQQTSMYNFGTPPEPKASATCPLDRVARVLLSKAFLFHLYSQYCSDFFERSERLEKMLRQAPVIRDFLHRCESSELCRGESLGSFLIKPVQRLTRYSLLLHKIRSEGSGRSCEQELTEAARRLGDIAELANKRQELADDSRKLAALCLECGGDQRVIAAGRRIIRMQNVAYFGGIQRGRLSHKKAREGRLVLFDDALMLVEPHTSRHGKGGYMIRWIVPLGRLTVRELHDHAGFSANNCIFLTGAETSDWLHAFEALVSPRDAGRTSWEENLSPPTHDAVEFWVARAGLRHQRRKAGQ